MLPINFEIVIFKKNLQKYVMKLPNKEVTL
jgi:hypothetical protein